MMQEVAISGTAKMYAHPPASCTLLYTVVRVQTLLTSALKTTKYLLFIVLVLQNNYKNKITAP